jgi:hypothetical protein
MSAARVRGFAYPASVLPPMATGVTRARLDPDAHLRRVVTRARWSADREYVSPENLERTAIGVPT